MVHTKTVAQELVAIRAFLDTLVHQHGCAKLLDELAACNCGLDDARAKATHFSPRERVVLGVMKTALTHKAMAHRLGVSEGTLRAYTSVLYRKLGITSLPLNQRVFVALHAEQILAGESMKAIIEGQA